MASVPIDLHAPYTQRVHDALHDKNMSTVLSRSTLGLSNSRVAAMGAVDGQRLRDQTRQMKEYVIRHLPDLLEQFEQKVKENGGQVHWARDAAEANRIVLDIAREHGSRKVVKSKSMVTEEIHLNSALEGSGMSVVETDLGEYIVQLAGVTPSHIVAPAAHMRIEDISEVLQQKLDIQPTLDPETMCSAARARLRREFLSADMGISGCNFGIAETGTVCIVTNEGNGRMVTTLPPVYVAIMGIEKLVPTVEDAFLQYQALSRSSTGQQFSVYLSMTGGPRRLGDTDGPEAFHVILLDNGRSDMLARGYGEALMCIRCGACLNVCPVYRTIGGHAYGSTYSGPIGSVISPILQPDAVDVNKLPNASSLCGACSAACPVKIDLPRLLLDLRSDMVQAGTTSWVEHRAIQGFQRTAQSRRLFENGAKAASFGTAILASMGGGSIRYLPPPFSAWTDSRAFPPLAKKSFRALWAERMAHRQPPGSRGE
jgi:L-lactate dehydrogenase complex protein LldF